MNDTTKLMTLTVTDTGDGKPAAIVVTKGKLSATIAVNRTIADLIDAILRVAAHGQSVHLTWQFRDAAGALQVIGVKDGLINLRMPYGRGRLAMLSSEARQFAAEIQCYALNGAWLRQTEGVRS